MQHTNSALEVLIFQIIVIVVMLGGFAMIIGAMTGTPLVGRMYRAIFRTLVLRPLQWGLRQTGRGAEWLLRWIGRQIGHFIQWVLWRLGLLLRWSAWQFGHLMVYLGRLLGRGIRRVWVRLTT